MSNSKKQILIHFVIGGEGGIIKKLLIYIFFDLLWWKERKVITLVHDFGKPLKTFTKIADEYKEKEMKDEASNELCKALELTDENVAILASRKYLIKKGFSIIRMT